MKVLLHLSDPHFGAADINAAEAFLAHAAEMQPCLTLVSGDLTMRARRNELEAAQRFTARLPSPNLIIPGNHDMPMINQPFARLIRPFGRYQKYFHETLEPEFTTERLQVISLNSSRAYGLHTDWSEGRLSKHQLAKIPARFTQREPGGLRVLMLHHPLLEPKLPGREVVKPLTGLLQTLEHAKVDLVLCGHFHCSQIATTGISNRWRTVVSQAPTVCSTRLQGEPQGFHEIRHNADSLQLIHHIYQGTCFRPATTYQFSRTADGWDLA